MALEANCFYSTDYRELPHNQRNKLDRNIGLLCSVDSLAFTFSFFFAKWLLQGEKRKIMYLFIEDVGKVMRKKSFLNREIAINGEI